MAPKRQASFQQTRADAAKRIRFATQSLPSQPRPNASSSTRPYDSDEEDYVGDIGMEEQDRKRAQQGRRGRIVTDMSDSDEDDEDEAGVEGQEGAPKGSDDSDEDMFGAGGQEKEQPQKKKTGLDLKDDEGEIGAEGDLDSYLRKHSGRDLPSNYDDLDKPDNEEFLQEVDPEFELESSENGDGVADDDDTGAGKQGSPVDGDQPDWSEDEDNPYKGLTNRQKQKRKQGMGYKIDEFSMKNENETGTFDEDGNYIENDKDPHAEQDTWLKGNYNRKAIKQARYAQLKRQQELDASRPEEEKLSAPALKARLAERMLRGESVLEALQRWGKAAHPPKKGRRQGKKADIEVDDANEDKAAEQVQQAKKALEEVTSYASILMAEHGLTGIYDETYEALLRAARRATIVEAEWDPAKEKEKDDIMDDTPSGPKPDQQYLYRYSPSYLAQTGAQQIDVFGPFAGSDLLAWAQQGYFGPGQDRILLQLAPAGGATANPDAWAAWGQQ